MKAAGFGAVFCNVGDFPPTDWETVRERAVQSGVVCGPWARTADADGDWDEERLHLLIDVATDWESPYIVNSEAELKGSGDQLTSYIAAACGENDWALSMEPWPFEDVDWTPIKVPALPQVFGPDWGAKILHVRQGWQARNVRCVVCTFGSYNGVPADYDRLSPYGVYTADDMGTDYELWSALGTCTPCVQQPPTNGGGMATKIGSQDGIKAACNRLRDLDPSGTLLQKAGGSWPDISTLPQNDVGSWKAYDKLQRTLQILKDDHDA